MPCRILREPAAQHPLFLKEHLVDAPQTAEGKASDNNGQDVVLKEQGDCAKGQTGREPYPPTLLPPPVFHLDNQRMTNTYTQEYGCADDDTIEIHATRYQTVCAAKFGKTDDIF